MDEHDKSVNKRKMGFAALSPERRKQIASRGGKAAQASGNGHHFTSEEAARAGKLGGKKVASIPGHMSELGKRGGKARHAKSGKV